MLLSFGEILAKKGDIKRGKVYAAKRFARGAMACPACRYVLEAPAPKCPKCGYDGHVAVKKFPFEAPELTRVLDAGKLLTEEEEKVLLDRMGKVAKLLPQVRFFLCLVPLSEEVDLREFGFWLYNAARVPEGDQAKEFGVLFLVDPKSKRMSVTVGYGLEPMVMDSEWKAVCQECRSEFFRERWVNGLERFLVESHNLLVRRGRELESEWKKGGKE